MPENDWTRYIKREDEKQKKKKQVGSRANERNDRVDRELGGVCLVLSWLLHREPPASNQMDGLLPSLFLQEPTAGVTRVFFSTLVRRLTAR